MVEATIVLVTGLHRLRGISNSAKNAFFNAQKLRWERERSIGTVAELDITGSREAGTDEPVLFPSWITWSPYMYRNMQAGYLKSLNVHLFLSLENSVAKALSRYLDAKRYDGTPIYRIGLKKLAFEHVGLSRCYFPSQIKRKLDPARNELIRCGFLGSAEYAEMKTQPGELMVVYRFPPRKAQAALPDPATAIAQRLIEQGVSRKDALEFAKAHAEECERQLGFLPHRDAKSPGAVLVKSIREGWSAPPPWMDAQARRDRLERARAAHPSGSTGPRECGVSAGKAAWQCAQVLGQYSRRAVNSATGTQARCWRG